MPLPKKLKSTARKKRLQRIFEDGPAGPRVFKLRIFITLFDGPKKLETVFGPIAKVEENETRLLLRLEPMAFKVKPTHVEIETRDFDQAILGTNVIPIPPEYTPGRMLEFTTHIGEQI